MKRIVILFMLVVSTAYTFAVPVIGVMDFKNSGPWYDNKFASQITEELQNILSSSKEVAVVERSQIGKVLKELKLQNSGIVKREYMIEIGKLCGARYLVVGSYSKEKKGIRLIARIVNTEDGLIVRGSATEIFYDRNGSLSEAAEKLGNMLLAKISGKNEDNASLESLHDSKPLLSDTKKQAVSEEFFNNFYISLSNESYDKGKIDLIRNSLKKENYFTSNQVKRVLQLFSYDSNRLKTAKLMYKYVVDPQNIHVIYPVFESEFSKKEFTKWIKNR